MNALSHVLMVHSQIQIITGAMLANKLVKHVLLGQIVHHVTIKQNTPMTTAIPIVKEVLRTHQIFIIALTIRVVYLNVLMVPS